MRYPLEKLSGHIDILPGYAFKSRDFSDAGVPVIKIKNVTPPSVTLEDLSFVSKEIAQAQSKFLLNYDDVLIALTGSHINQMASVVGRVARVKYHDPSLLNQRVGKIFAIDPDDTNIDYVYYFLSQNEIKIKLASKAGGAANQANISPSDVKNLEIPFPDIESQRRIASILLAYDHLIENNQKQIKLLEEAAKRLYKEWFVDFRFPGYEDTPIIDGVPEGWEKKKVTDLLRIRYGKDHKTLEDGDIPVYGSGGIMRKVKPILYSGESVLIPRKGSLNNIFYVNGDFWTIDTMFYSIPLIEKIAKYAYLFLSRLDMYSFNIGAAVPSMTVNILDGIDILLPDKDTISAFDRQVGLLFNRIEILKKQSEKAAEARDRLLPKLMSGEMEV